MPRFNIDDYVSVQTRINTFWQEHPNGTIKTKLEEHVGIGTKDAEAVFSAVVDTGDHPNAPENFRAVATGWGSESKQDFAGGYLEKSETKAIGRALVNLGYAKGSDDRPSREEMDSANRREERGQQERRQAQPVNPVEDDLISVILGLDLPVPEQRPIWMDMIERATPKEALPVDVPQWRKLVSYARRAYSHNNLQMWRMVELMRHAPNPEILSGMYQAAIKDGMTKEVLDITVDQRHGEFRNANSPDQEIQGA